MTDRRAARTLRAGRVATLATTREKVDGHLVPVLVNTLGMRRFATVVLAQGLKQVDIRRADWVIGFIADQDRTAMVRAWVGTSAGVGAGH